MARSKIGRNEPCPCGSGKKHKRCCMASEGAVSMIEHRYRRALDDLPRQLLEFVDESFPQDPMPWALLEWTGGQEEFLPQGELHQDLLSGPAFFDWYLFNWIPSDEEGPAADPDRVWPIAAAYAASRRGRLDRDTLTAIEGLAGRTWGLWSVKEVRPDDQIVFENVFCRQEVTALDHSAARSLVRGAMIYAGFAEFEGVTFLMSGSIIVPPSWRPQLVSLRERMSGGRGWLTPRACADREAEIRLIYLSIAHELLHPRPPQMVNTEGDPMRFVTHEFRLRISPDEAFGRLSDLSDAVPDELLADAERDDAGRLIAVEFSWDKPAPRPDPLAERIVVATFRMRGDRLTVEVNSERRAKNVKAMVKRRLGGGAELIRTTRQELDEAMAEGKVPGGLGAGGGEGGLAGPGEMPAELREMIAERMRAHWEQWFDDSVPALDGQTPREAARTERGRELLEALFADYEQKSQLQPEFAPDVGELRRRLGM